MQFKPETNEQANEVYFSRKPNTDEYIPTKLNDSPVQLCESQKHLGVILDKHLNFHEHFERKIKICNKLIDTIKHLSAHLPKKNFANDLQVLRLTTPDNPVNKSLISKLEKVQYQACLATTGTIQGMSRESLYRELGLGLSE